MLLLILVLTVYVVAFCAGPPQEYLAQGRDGYDVFTQCKVLVDEEAGVVIPSTVKNHFIQVGLCLALAWPAAF